MFPQLLASLPRRSPRLVVPAAVLAGLLGSNAAEAQPGPRILHEGLNCIVAGEHVILEAVIEPVEESLAVKAYFRAAIHPLFYFVEMSRVGDVYQGVLPKPNADIGEAVYYIEAVNSTFQSARTVEFTPEVAPDGASCRDKNPVPPAYLDGPANITVGATGAGPNFPEGFLSDGIVSTITAAGRVTTGGGGPSAALAIGAGAGAAAGVGVLVAGGGDDSAAANTSTAPVVTTSVVTTSVPATTTVAPTTMVTACFETRPDPPRIAVGGTVRFDAGCSQPPPEGVARYDWTFNDGRGDREGRVITRVYNQAGVFPAELTVTDLAGNTDRVSRDVRVEETPPPPPGGGGGGPGNVVTISKSAPGSAGGPFAYNITVTNTGSTAASGLTLTDNVPASLSISLVTFSAAVDNCGQAANTVTCNSSNLAAGGSFTVTINVTPSGPGFVTNTATVVTTSPSESASASASTTLTQLAFPDAPGRLAVRFRSHLEVPPGDGSLEARVTTNETRIDTTNNAAPFVHDVAGRAGDNVVEGTLSSLPMEEGLWRFDFEEANGLEPGSFRVEAGQVLSQGARTLVFRVARGERHVLFRYRLTP